MPIIKVNVSTHHEEVGSCYDWADFEVTEELKARITELRDAVAAVKAAYIEDFDDRLEFHWDESDVRTGYERLVVTPIGDFWWEGEYRHTDIIFSTARLSLRDLDVTEDTDKRDDVAEEDENAL